MTKTPSPPFTTGRNPPDPEREGAFTLGGQKGFPGLENMPEARTPEPGLDLIDGIAECV